MATSLYKNDVATSLQRFWRWFWGSPLGWLALLWVLIAIWQWSWPVWPWFFLSATGWYLAVHLGRAWRQRRGTVWLAAARQTLAPVTIGLAALVLALIALNLFHPLLEPATLRDLELQLIHLKLRLKDATDSLPLFFILLAAALAASWLLPRWKALATLRWFQTAATATYVALLAMTSFTLFSQAPLQDLVRQGARDQRQRVAAEITQYHALLRQRHDAVAKHLAATIVSHDLGQLDSSQLQILGRRLQAVHAAAAKVSVPLAQVFGCGPHRTTSFGGFDAAERCARLRSSEHRADEVTVSKSDVRDLMVRRLARADWQPVVSAAIASSVASTSENAPAPVALPGDKPPATLGEWQRRLEAEQEQDRRNAELRLSNETAEPAQTRGVTAAKMTASQLLGGLLPDMPGLIGSYFDAAVDELVESAGDRLAAWNSLARWVRIGRLPVFSRDVTAALFRGAEPQADPALDPEIVRMAQEVRSAVHAELVSQTRQHPPDFLVLLIERIGRRSSPLDPNHPEDPAHPAEPFPGPEPIRAEPVHPIAIR